MGGMWLRGPVTDFQYVAPSVQDDLSQEVRAQDSELLLLPEWEEGEHVRPAPPS